MKTAAFLLKLMFALLMVTTLALLATKIKLVPQRTAAPVFTQAQQTAPSVYAYTRLDGK